MKLNKLFAGVLAAAMMMSVGVSAMAATANSSATNGTGWNDDESITVTKKYVLANDGTTNPEETFGFSDVTFVGVTDAGVGAVEWANEEGHLPTIDSVKFEEGDATKAGASKTATITLPTYEYIGVYEYKFNEVTPDTPTAGVTYHNDEIKLIVTVIQGANGKVRVAAVHTEKTGDKSDVFVNTYTANTLTVSKEVAGTKGDRNADFTFTVKFEAPEGKMWENLISTSATAVEGQENTYTFTLKHGDSMSFGNIPEGVKYTITETAVTGYTTKINNNDSTGVHTSAMDADGETVEYLNIAGDYNPDTGVILDNAPYILMLAVVAGGVFFMVAKKRREE